MFICLVPVVERVVPAHRVEQDSLHPIPAYWCQKETDIYIFGPVQWNVSECRCSACLHTLYSNTVWKHSSLSCMEPFWFGLCWMILLLLMQMMVMPKKAISPTLGRNNCSNTWQRKPNFMQYIAVYWCCVFFCLFFWQMILLSFLPFQSLCDKCFSVCCSCCLCVTEEGEPKVFKKTVIPLVAYSWWSSF